MLSIMNNYQFFSISGQAPEVEIALQVLYYAEQEKRVDQSMGCPGQLSANEWRQLESDIIEANYVLEGHMITIHGNIITKEYTPQQFIEGVYSNALFIHFSEHYVQDKTSGRKWTWSI